MAEINKCHNDLNYSYPNSYLFFTPIQPEWNVIQSQLGYPRPQGNIPMIKRLRKCKQDSLIKAYNDVLKNN